MTSSRSSGITFLLLLSLVLNSHAQNEEWYRVPPFNVSQQSLLKHLRLGNNISFDVPALYVFGDSVVDSGNNNFLPTNSKSNYFPFGLDFGGNLPTGRFTNGRTEADFIAQAVGLPFPPPYYGLSQKERESITSGVNFASSSCGILPKTARYFGDCLSMDKQVHLFRRTLKGLKDEFKANHSKARHLSKSLFFINIGNADIGFGYDGPLSTSKMNRKCSFEEYAHYLSQQFSKRVVRLYKAGARKFLVNSIGALGCVPSELITLKPKTLCVEETNRRAILVNSHLSEMLHHLQINLPGSKFVFGDVYKVLIDVVTSPAAYGMKDARNSCCVDLAGNGTRPCTPGIKPCRNRNRHVFFDPFHPSEATHYLFASRCFKDSSICSPITLLQLLKA